MNERVYACSKCKKQFRQLSNMRRHEKNKHTRPHIRAQLNVLERPIKFHKRDVAFTAVRNVNRHTREVHMKHRLFDCPKCEKRFGQARNLRRHEESVHMGTGYRGKGSHACPECDRWFVYVSTMQRHCEQVHTMSRIDDPVGGHTKIVVAGVNSDHLHTLGYVVVGSTHSTIHTDTITHRQIMTMPIKKRPLKHPSRQASRTWLVRQNRLYINYRQASTRPPAVL
jgi:DNA-directed RNA polymerase subunit RPC12/RpoP